MDKYQAIQKVSATSGLEQEEQLLQESAHKEANYASAIADLEKELKQVKTVLIKNQF